MLYSKIYKNKYSKILSKLLPQNPKFPFNILNILMINLIFVYTQAYATETYFLFYPNFGSLTNVSFSEVILLKTSPVVPTKLNCQI